MRAELSLPDARGRHWAFSTPEVELIDWVFTQGNVTPWDVIRFDTGTVVAFMPAGARA